MRRVVALPPSEGSLIEDDPGYTEARATKFDQQRHESPTQKTSSNVTISTPGPGKNVTEARSFWSRLEGKSGDNSSRGPANITRKEISPGKRASVDLTTTNTTTGTTSFGEITVDTEKATVDSVILSEETDRETKQSDNQHSSPRKSFTHEFQNIDHINQTAAEEYFTSNAGAEASSSPKKDGRVSNWSPQKTFAGKFSLSGSPGRAVVPLNQEVATETPKEEQDTIRLELDKDVIRRQHTNACSFIELSSTQTSFMKGDIPPIVIVPTADRRDSSKISPDPGQNAVGRLQGLALQAVEPALQAYEGAVPSATEVHRRRASEKTSSGRSVGVSASPVFLPQPVDSYQLLVTAVEAKGLLNAQRFGLQTPFLQLTVGDQTVRTFGCKKGGSSAKWNQNFVIAVPNVNIHLGIIAKNDNSIIGTGIVDLASLSVGEASERWIQLSKPNEKEVQAGEVFLQLRLVDSAKAPEPVPKPSQQDSNNSVLKSTTARSTDEDTDISRPATVPSPLTVDLSLDDRNQSTVDRRRCVNDRVWKGGFLWKVPFTSSSQPKRRWFRVTGLSDADPEKLEWSDPGKKKSKSSSIQVLDIKGFQRGHGTSSFWVNGRDLPHERLCFSLLLDDRTLDLVAESVAETEEWLEGLSLAAFGTNKAVPPPLSSSSSRQSVASLKWTFNNEGSDEDSSSTYRGSAPTNGPLSPSGPSHVPPLSPNISMSPVGSGGQPTNGPRPSSSSSTVTVTSRRSQSELHQYWLNNLFKAARNNRLVEISEMFSKGCPVDLMEAGTGDTVLVIACKLGLVKIVELCLSWRAKNDPHPEFGETALQAAVSSQNAACAGLLLATAAESQMDYVIVNHEYQNKDGGAPIHMAGRNGDLSCVELLVHHGADIHLVDAHGRTALHCSCLKGSAECVAYLLDAGADSVINNSDNYGDTPLHAAAWIGNTAVVELLLQTAADIHAVNKKGQSPLQISIMKNWAECTLLLREYDDTSEPAAFPEPPSSPVTHSPTLSPPTPPTLGPPQSLSHIESSLMSPRMSASHWSQQPSAMQGHPFGAYGVINDSAQMPMFKGLQVSYPSNNGPAYMNHPVGHMLDTLHPAYGAVPPHPSLGSNIPYSPLMSPHQASMYGGGVSSAVPPLYTQQPASLPPASAYITPRDAIRRALGSMSSPIGPGSSMYETSGHTYSWPQPGQADAVSHNGYPHMGVGAADLSAQYSNAYSLENHNYVIAGETDPAAGHAGYAQSSSVETGSETYSGTVQIADAEDVWEVYYDDSGYPYYVNLTLNQSQWEDPREGLAEAPISITSAEGCEQFSVPQGYGVVAQPPVSDTQYSTSTTADAEVGVNETVVEAPQNIEATPALQLAPVLKVATPVEDTKLSIQTESSTGNLTGVSLPSPRSLMARRGLQNSSAASLRVQIEPQEQKKEAPVLNAPKSRSPSPRARPPTSPRPKKSEAAKSPSVKGAEVSAGQNGAQAKISDSRSREGEPEVGSKGAVSNAVAPTAVVDVATAETFAPYWRMITVGVADAAITQKMKVDNVPETLREQFWKTVEAKRQAPVPTTQQGLSSSGPGGGGATSALTVKETREKLRGDPAFEKYFKMLSYGVPIGSVRLKMMSDAMSNSDIVSFCGEDEKSVTNKASSLAKLNSRRDIPLMKLHWDPLSEEKVKGSVWSLAVDQTGGHETGNTKHLRPDEVRELETLFAVKSSTVLLRSSAGGDESQSGDSSVGVGKPKILDLKRANNVSIALAQFRGFSSLRDVAKCVIEFDCQALSLDRLQTLREVLPTEAEARSFRNLRPEEEQYLVKAEQFFFLISRIPRMTDKVEVFVHMQQFASDLKQIRDGLESISVACAEIMGSLKLTKVLQKLLAVGNLMNEGTLKGQASGFTLDSLMKTTEMKGVDKKTTLLDLVVKMSLEKQEQNQLDFPQEILHVEPAMRHSLVDIRNIFSTISQRATLCDQELKLSEEEVNGNTETSQESTAGYPASGGASSANPLLAEIAKAAAKRKVAKGKSTESSQDPFFLPSKRSLERLRVHSDASKIEIESLERQIDGVTKQVSRLAEYFGENSSVCTSEKIFGVLIQFAKAYERSREACSRRAKSRNSSTSRPPQTSSSLESTEQSESEVES